MDPCEGCGARSPRWLSPSLGPALPGAAFVCSEQGWRCGWVWWEPLWAAGRAGGVRDGGTEAVPSCSQTQTALLRCPEKYDGITEPWNGLLGTDPEGHRAPTPTTGPPSGYSGLPGAPSDLLRARGSAEARGAALLTVVVLRLLTQRRLPALTGASAAPLSSSHLLTPQGRPGCSVPTAAPRADRRGLQSPLPGAGP